MIKNLNYSFSTVGSYYDIPKKPDHKIFIGHITSLPQFHPPEVYGLHRSGDNEDIFFNMVIGDILGKLPPNYDLELAKQKYPVSYKESMNTVLVQEMERFTKLLNEIRNSLRTIQKAIKGLVVMTPALESIQHSLLLGRIPAAWAKVSYPSLKSLPSYIADFIERTSFLNDWFLNGKPVNYWISGFFFTQAFITGAKQNYARKYRIPIDQITFDFQILKVASTDFAPSEGIYVYGLFTDGARWDIEKGVLAELHPKILNDYMPLMWLFPILGVDYNEKGRYNCPLYKTSERRGVLSTTGHSTNYVLPFLLNTDENLLIGLNEALLSYVN
ncbi:hypothetical protein FQA39_LY01193 [Lamprigera yunnana]|nr:hypothetical protein FQA39_LY01193 [Lamprigera yunnana]